MERSGNAGFRYRDALLSTARKSGELRRGGWNVGAGGSGLLDLPLGVKIPVRPGTKPVFWRTRLGVKLHHPSPQFDLGDPHCRQLRTEYNSLHDPHLQAFHNRRENLRNLKKRGLITNDGKVVCTLKEFNAYRQYLTRLKLQCEETKWREEDKLGVKMSKKMKFAHRQMTRVDIPSLGTATTEGLVLKKKARKLQPHKPAGLPSIYASPYGQQRRLKGALVKKECKRSLESTERQNTRTLRPHKPAGTPPSNIHRHVQHRRLKGALHKEHLQGDLKSNECEKASTLQPHKPAGLPSIYASPYGQQRRLKGALVKKERKRSLESTEHQNTRTLRPHKPAGSPSSNTRRYGQHRRLKGALHKEHLQGDLKSNECEKASTLQPHKPAGLPSIYASPYGQQRRLKGALVKTELKRSLKSTEHQNTRTLQPHKPAGPPQSNTRQHVQQRRLKGALVKKERKRSLESTEHQNTRTLRPHIPAGSPPSNTRRHGQHRRLKGAFLKEDLQDDLKSNECSVNLPDKLPKLDTGMERANLTGNIHNEPASIEKPHFPEKSNSELSLLCRRIAKESIKRATSKVKQEEREASLRKLSKSIVAKVVSKAKKQLEK